MRIHFAEFMDKVCRVSGCASQTELAALLGVNRSAVTQAKNRDAVPEKWLFILARKFSLNSDWFERSDTEDSQVKAELPPPSPSPGKKIAGLQVYMDAGGRYRNIIRPEPDYNPEIVEIPKVSAVLCAGAGSLAADAEVLERIPLPFSLIRSWGAPESLVFMDVTGDSMEPGIRHGDTVLIDQAARGISPASIMAVGHEDCIYIKRVHKNTDGSVVLLSDNPAYSPLVLAGDELDSFRVIGRLVRLFRVL